MASTVKITTAEFLKRARQKHGDKYDYSLVEYVNARTKVRIICAAHGEFRQLPGDHYRPYGVRGCPQCARMPHTTSQFIEKARKKHGDKYDYSKVNYVHCNTDVIIVCPQHGEFSQRPANHLATKPKGCRPCGAERSIVPSWEETLEAFRKAHGDKYDYSQSRYTRSTRKISIICPHHGEFKQSPIQHKRGGGCPSCGREATQLAQRDDKQKVIEQFKAIHGDKYDYSEVDYINNTTPVKISCPLHGAWLQVPNSHKAGHGCHECGRAATIASQTKSVAQIIESFRAVHGNKYDYSQVTHRPSLREKITIICPHHGEFQQARNDHQQGNGCQKCAFSFRSESLMREAVEEIFSRHGKYLFPKERPSWLRNPQTNRKLELDCYNEELGVAFEFHGTQHYKPIGFYGGEKAFAKVRRRDIYKQIQCRNREIVLIEIDGRGITCISKEHLRKEKLREQVKLSLTKLKPHEKKWITERLNKKEK
tara:strand:- start:327 stop:1766 length:1440 start_codon:yes stop_codon:yes gene_type:complete